MNELLGYYSKPLYLQKDHIETDMAYHHPNQQQEETLQMVLHH